GRRADDGKATAGTGELLESRDGAIVTLTMVNAGKLNAMSLRLRDALIEAFARLNDDDPVRAIVLTGADGNFSAGADMAGWGEKTLQECRTRLRRGGARLVREMIARGKPGGGGDAGFGS